MESRLTLGIHVVYIGGKFVRVAKTVCSVGSSPGFKGPCRCMSSVSVACHIPSSTSPEIPIELEIGFSTPIAPSPDTLHQQRVFYVSARRSQRVFNAPTHLALAHMASPSCSSCPSCLLSSKFPPIKLHNLKPGVLSEGLICPCLAQIFIRVSNISVG